LSLKTSTVLFADDDIKYASQFSQTLSYFFQKVLVANDGEETLSIFKNNDCDVIILDIEMPKLNGIEVAKKIREIDENIPIFIITNFQDLEVVRSGYKIQLVDYLIKPITFETLLETLNRCEKALPSKNKINISNNISYCNQTKCILSNNNILKLSPFESLVIELLLKNKSNVVTFEKFDNILIANNLSSMSLKNIIYKLRQKLPKNTIESKAKLGYLIR
jgi:two-component system, OmpR family, response regulator VanR